MKPIFLVLALVPVFAFSQMSAGIGSGINADSKLPVAEVFMAYQLQKVVLTGGYKVSITRKSNCANFFGGTIGFNYKNFIPAVGYFYDYRDAEIKEENKAVYAYSLKYLINTNNEDGGFFAEVTYIENTVLITAGARITVNFRP